MTLHEYTRVIALDVRIFVILTGTTARGGEENSTETSESPDSERDTLCKSLNNTLMVKL